MRAPAPSVGDAVAKLSLSPGSNFFSSGLRQKVDQLMDILYAGGVNNPMDSIEQISYLLFLRLLSERDEQLALLDKRYKRIFAGAWSKYAWGNFVTLTGDNLFNAVRDAIEKLHELPGLSETGKLLFNRATLKVYDRPTLRAVIQGSTGWIWPHTTATTSRATCTSICSASSPPPAPTASSAPRATSSTSSSRW